MLAIQEQIARHFAAGIAHRRIHVEILEAGILFGLRFGKIVEAVNGGSLAGLAKAELGACFMLRKTNGTLGKSARTLA